MIMKKGHPCTEKSAKAEEVRRDDGDDDVEGREMEERGEVENKREMFM
jgi:hypothetical protein